MSKSLLYNSSRLNINFVLLPVVLSSVFLLSSYYCPVFSLILIGICIALLISVINIDWFVYILLAVLMIVNSQIPKEYTKFTWIIIGILFLIFLITKLLSNKKIILPLKEILYFFGVFWILIILSNIYNLDELNILESIRMFFFTMLIFMYYDWSYNKSPFHILVPVLFPAVVVIVMMLIEIIENPNIFGIGQIILFRFRAFFTNANHLGGYLNTIIPVLFVLVAMKYPKKYYKLLLGLLVLLFLALILSNSRAAYLGTFVSLFVISMLMRKLRKPVLTILFVVIIMISTIPVFQMIFEFFLRLNNDPTSGRIDIWIAAMDIVKDNYFLGVGLGNHTTYLSEYLPIFHLKYYLGGLLGVHNLYLGKAVEVGILAIPLFLFLIFSFGKYIISNLKFKLSYEQKVLNFAALGVLISVFIRSFFEGSVLIQRGGMFPIFYSWIVLIWSMQIFQKNKKIEELHSPEHSSP